MNADRFVILHHLAPTGEHWDLMLERGHVLITWQLLAQPTGRDAFPIACVRIQDHRKRYLNYQGPVSGGRGLVTQVDAGTYELLAADDQSWVVELIGRRLRGIFRIERTGEQSRSQWTAYAV